MALLPACKTGLSDDKIIAATAPDLIIYDADIQKKAATEMQQYCAIIPTVCSMMGDYKVMRDQTRINMSTSD